MLGVVVHTAFLYSLGLLVTLQCSRHDLSSCFGVFFLEPFSRKNKLRFNCIHIGVNMTLEPPELPTALCVSWCSHMGLGRCYTV